MKDSVKKFKMLEKGDTVLIGVSGGPDSTALAYLIKEFEEAYNLKLHIFHLNHQLRGRESDEDALFVQRLAAILQIPVTIESFDVSSYIEKEKLSLQEGARIIRYRLMEEKAREINATKIAIGQNADDQAETVLMRFLRGAGTKGLSGILPIRDGKYIRPLIEIWREEIEEFLLKSNIQARIDKSNLKTVYLRNKIRLNLIPYLRQEYNPNISRVLTQMSSVFREENSYIEQVAEKVLATIIVQNVPSKIEVDTGGFLSQHIALQRRMLTLLWEQTTKVANGLSFNHIEQGLMHITKGQVGTRFNLPKGFWLVNKYNSFCLEKTQERETAIDSFCFEIKVPGVTQISERSIKIVTDVETFQEQENYRQDPDQEIELDYELLKNKRLCLRNRLPGDRFRPLNGNGSKKLKDYFIDSKIPRQGRDEIPLLTVDNQILWIVGYTINDAFKITHNTKKIIRIKLDKN